MTDAAPHSGRTNWPLVLLAYATGVVCACQVGKTPVALADLRADLGLGLLEASWVISMFSVVSLAGGLAAGLMAARFGDRVLSVGGLAILAVGCLMGAASSDSATLLLSRFVEGAGFLFAQIAAVALIHRYAAAHDQKFAFGLWGSYMGVGQAIVMLAAPLALTAFGWRGLWVANAAVAVVAALTIAVAARAPGVGGVRAAPAGRSLSTDLRAVLAARGPLALALCFLCYSFNYGGIIGFLPTVLIDLADASIAQAAVLTALAVLANAAGNLAGGALLQRGVPRGALLAGAQIIIGVCAVGMFASASPFAVRYPLCLIAIGLGGVIPATLFGAVARFAPTGETAPVVNGLMVQGSSLGQVAGPPALAAVAAATWAWDWAAAVIAASSIAGVVLALRIRALDRAAGGGAR